MAKKPVVNFERYPEERIDPLTGRAVIIASSRSLREKKIGRLAAYDVLPELDAKCPFCPGNEGETTEELFRTGNSHGWDTRMFDNLFPFLVIEEPKRWKKRGFFDDFCKPAIGAHRVIVGTRFHNKGITQVNVAGACSMLQAVTGAYFDLQSDSRFNYFLCFGNYGAEGAASQPHLHWQVVAKKEVEPSILARFLNSHEYWLRNGGECLVCRLIREEKQAGLSVAENEDFEALVPFAAAHPYELRIFPKRHHSSYPIHLRDEQPDALQNLAKILVEALLRIKRCVQEDIEDLATTSDHPYNIGFHTARYGADNGQGTFHYHVEIMPRITRMGGYELATGQIVNPYIPEEMAEKLREAKVES